MSDDTDEKGADGTSSDVPEPAPVGIPQKSDDRRRPVVVVGLVLVVALVAGYFFFAGGDEAQAGEVFLEPAVSEGPFPWTGSVAAPDAPTSVPLPTLSAVPSQFADPSAPAKPPTVRVVGDRAGIYGGSLNRSVCDKAKLIGFLGENPSKARAFASVLGISPADIRAYVESLTPVILGADAVVTNHGFKDGKPTPRQSVLQAGTAVLVDDRGVPRVRCYCGNPLLPPVVTSSPPVYVGTRWPEFNPARVIIIQPAPVSITQITVVNVFEGGTVVVPVAAQPRPVTVVTTPSSSPAESQLVKVDGTYRLVQGASTCDAEGTSPIESIDIAVVGGTVTLGAAGESIAAPLMSDGSFKFEEASSGGFIDLGFVIQGRFVQSGSTVVIRDGQVVISGGDDPACTINFTGERVS